MKLTLTPASGTQGSKPLIGQKGVSYGLQGAPASVPKPQKKGTALFTIDDDDDLNVLKRMEMEETQRRNQEKAAEAMAKALAEDPMAFEYDAVYKEMKKEEIQRKAVDKETGKPKAKYMDQLLKNSEIKAREDMVVLQKKLQRELAAEKEVFGEAQETKYVTSAYKREIEKNKLYEAEVKAKEERDRKNSIMGRGHMGEFYKNLLDSRSSGQAIKTEEDVKKAMQEAKEKAEAEERRGRKRSREESDEDSDDRIEAERERERDRIARLQERAAKDAVEAERLRSKREAEKTAKMAELQAEYAKHHTTEDAAQLARERYLARKRSRLDAGPEAPPQ